MQRTAATSRIEEIRFYVGPKINQLTAIRNAMHDCFAAICSRRVEAAMAASTRAGHKDGREVQHSKRHSDSHRRNSHKVSIQNADSFD